jgi:hypothetical protein
MILIVMVAFLFHIPISDKKTKFSLFIYFLCKWSCFSPQNKKITEDFAESLDEGNGVVL